MTKAEEGGGAPGPHYKPKLLVSGMCGRIGSRLAATAAARFELVNLDLAVGVDITDRDALRRIVARHRDAGSMIHLAAFTDVSEAHRQNGDRDAGCWRVNVIGTRFVTEACRENGIHLIHVSTDFVFDGKSPGARVETDAPSPIEWYGETKHLAERGVMNEERGWTVVRISYPYSGLADGGEGAGAEPGLAAGARPDVVEGIRARLATGIPVPLFDDQIITPTFAGDITEGLLLLARLRPDREVFHLTGSTPVTPFDLGLKIARAFNFDPHLVEPTPMAAHLKRDPRPRHARLMMSNAKWSALAQRHGLHPPLGIDEGLARVVRERAARRKE